MSNIKLFQNQKIRATFIESEQKWYFAIIDVVKVLSESANARKELESKTGKKSNYWQKLFASKQN